jgi:hypothetical protein
LEKELFIKSVYKLVPFRYSFNNVSLTFSRRRACWEAFFASVYLKASFSRLSSATPLNIPHSFGNYCLATFTPKMRVSTLLTALTTLGLFNVALGEHAEVAPWRRSKHNAHRRQYAPVGSSGYTPDSDAAAAGPTVALRKVTGREFELERRYDDARFSFYDAGLGACGIVNTGADFVSALSLFQGNVRY